MAKATMATVKSFVRKNRDNLMIDCRSSFDGMVDCVMPDKDRGTFSPALYPEHSHENNMNIQGAWFVGGSRNSITPYNKDGMVGFDIYNCCGHFVLAVKE